MKSEPKGLSLYRHAASHSFDPHFVHTRLMESTVQELGWRGQEDFNNWRDKLKRGLLSCIGVMPDPVPLNAEWHEKIEDNGFCRQRVDFSVEEGARAIGWLLTPDTAPPPAGRPTMICLQGHSSGAHISFGEMRYDGDQQEIADDHDYALQAVSRGFNAFALEQRGFGERMDSRPAAQRSHYDYTRPFSDERCRHLAMTALLLGRTLIGERVHDVRRSVDLLENLPEVDPNRIASMGNSGGGTVSWYAAALDERIAAAMPGGCVCSYSSSIGRIDHCTDNYLPGALRLFEMGDLAGLIAPRPLTIVAGDRDPIFPLDGVKESVATAESIYEYINAADKLGFHVGKGGHRFYAAAWETFLRCTGW